MSHLFYAALAASLTSCGDWGLYYPGEGAPNPQTAGRRLVVTVNVAAVRIGERAQFTGSGGKPPYVFSLTSGGGSVTQTGVFVATATGVAVIRVTDADRATAEAAIIVEADTSARRN